MPTKIIVRFDDICPNLDWEKFSYVKTKLQDLGIRSLLGVIPENKDKSFFKYPHKDNFFDLTMESTMFVQLSNRNVSKKIAEEMIRITKKKGYILLIDWRYGKLNNSKFVALSKKRVIEIFKVNKSTQLISIVPGMLIPPLGRFFSKNFSCLYFLVAKIFPFFVGQVGYILKKI